MPSRATVNRSPAGTVPAGPHPARAGVRAVHGSVTTIGGTGSTVLRSPVLARRAIRSLTAASGTVTSSDGAPWTRRSGMVRSPRTTPEPTSPRPGSTHTQAASTPSPACSRTDPWSISDRARRTNVPRSCRLSTSGNSSAVPPVAEWFSPPASEWFSPPLPVESPLASPALFSLPSQPGSVSTAPLLVAPQEQRLPEHLLHGGPLVVGDTAWPSGAQLVGDQRRLGLREGDVAAHLPHDIRDVEGRTADPGTPEGDQRRPVVEGQRGQVVDLRPGHQDAVLEQRPLLTEPLVERIDAGLLQIAEVLHVVDVAVGVHVRPADRDLDGRGTGRHGDRGRGHAAILSGGG